MRELLVWAGEALGVSASSSVQEATTTASGIARNGFEDDTDALSDSDALNFEDGAATS